MARLISVINFLNPLKLWSHKRWLILIIILLAVLGFFLWPRPKTELPNFVTVKRGDIASTVSASGTLAGKEDVELHFKSTGKLAYLNFKVGDKINKGDRVAGLDVQDLNIALQQAWNNLRDKQATVDKVLDDVKNSDTSETFTQKQNRTTAQVARDNAFDSVKAAQRAFQDAILYAPISGIVVKADPVPNQNVATTDTIIQIADDSQIIFATDVDEADVSKISPHQSVDVTLNAYPDQTFSGTVSEITPLTKTTSAGATVVTVKINLLKAPPNLVIGLNGQAQITTAQAKNVLTIPQEALKDDGTVLVKNNDQLQLVKVRTGIRSDNEVEITQGLTEGQEVVTNPSVLPSPGPNNPLVRFFRLGGGGAGRGR